MSKLEKPREKKVKNFIPSQNGFRFVNRFPGIPLPDALEKLINTSDSVHGLCGGMCFTVIDHVRAHKSLPNLSDVPGENSRLYQYLHSRQLASWGIMSTQVLRYVYWMSLSDEKAQEESGESWEELRKRLDEDDLTVLGLVYFDLRETLRVWDNHQVLAYGYTEHPNGMIQVHLYDPNYPKRDDVSLELKPVKAGEKSGPGGFACTQMFGSKSKAVHGFFCVPYEPEAPPDDLVD